MATNLSNPRSPQFGAILFRVSELIGRQGADIFQRLGIRIGADKISIILTIANYGPQSSSDLAALIGHSRQLIELKLKSCISDGVLESQIDAEDSRRRLYHLAPTSRDEVDRVLTIMRDFEDVYDALWKEIGVNVEDALLAMEKALTMSELYNRLAMQFPEHATEMEKQL